MDNNTLEFEVGETEIIRPLSPQEKAKYNSFLEQDPWEAVIYLASIKHKSKARKELAKQLEELVKQLQGEFLMDGVLLGGPDDAGRYIVSVGGGRYAVQLAIQSKPLSDELVPDQEKVVEPGPLPDELIPGREVWIRPKDKAIVELRDTYSQGIDGVLLGGPDEDDRYIVGIAGGRYAVQLLVDPQPSSDELSPGREVWIHPESKAILKLRDTYFQGEVVPVTQVMDTDGTTIPSPEPDAVNASVTQRLLLKVKSHQEEIMVEAVPALAQQKPEAGDLVRIIPSLGVALELVSRQQQDTLLFEIPDVKYEDIGGLDEEVAQIQEAIDKPYLHPEIFDQYKLQRPRGILLYGPPGCGKTMIAKAIANNLSRQIEYGLPRLKEKLEQYLALDGSDSNCEAQRTELERFLRARDLDPAQAAKELENVQFAIEQGSKSYFRSIKGPELLSKWVGEGEANIRSLFATARERATFTMPVVLFFDEIESMFSRRGSGISSDIQKTIVPQLLAEMDGLEETRHVIVIGATNRFDLVDPAVLRPGRLDFKIKISRPNRNREAPRAILRKYLTLDMPFPLDEISIAQEVQEALGQTAKHTVLTDCLTAAVNSLGKVKTIHQVALFLIDPHHVDKSEQRLSPKWSRCTTFGIAPDLKESSIRAWSADDGIAQRVVRSGQKKLDPKHSPQGISAWPILVPDDPSIVVGALVVSHTAPELSGNTCERIEGLVAALGVAIQARWEYANRLIERTLDILFHRKSCLVITELIGRQRDVQEMKREPRKVEKQVWEIISGAMLESVVSRAKRVAVKRAIEDENTGITWPDLYRAIRLECQEGKDQYIHELRQGDPTEREQAYHDIEQFHVDVRLPPLNAEAAPVDPLALEEREATSGEEIPDVEYEDIGGLDDEIAKIKEAIEQPYLHPTIFLRYNLQRPGGILLYGPPGCGKTMIAKAIANNLSRQVEISRRQIKTAIELYLKIGNGEVQTEATAEHLYREWLTFAPRQDGEERPGSLPQEAQRRPLQIALEKFMSSQGVAPMQAAEELQEINLALEQGIHSYFINIKGPEILSKWVGESESTIRGIFARARDRATFYTPVVLFFDEIESLFSRRGGRAGSDIQSTIVPQLLAEMDGVDEMRHVIVIGASNRFDLIDPAVLRPGRLDFRIKIPRPNQNRHAPRSILLRYLTPDLPFPPSLLVPQTPEASQKTRENDSQSSERMKEPQAEGYVRITEILGSRAVESPTLNECLTAAMDNLVAAHRGFKAALFLTDWYTIGLRTKTDTRRPVKELDLRAVAGFDEPEQRKATVKAWTQKENGIAWDVVRACAPSEKQVVPQNASQSVTPEMHDQVPDSQSVRFPLSRQVADSEAARVVSAWPVQAPNDASLVLGALVIEHDEQTLSDEVCEYIQDIASALGITIQARREYADHLIERILDIVFHSQSRLVITELAAQQTAAQKKSPPRTLEKQVRDIVSGAMLESVVSRAKRIAVKREIEGGEVGIIWPDLYQAIEQECEEGKDQYSFELYSDDPYRSQTYQDTERVKVSVTLPGVDATAEEHITWLLRRPYAWRRASS